MIALIGILILCLSAAFLQMQHHQHVESIRAGRGRLSELTRRVAKLETSKADEFDPIAFEDLKSKVDTMRIAQGMKGR